MKLRFATLQAGHRLWRDLDLLEALTQSIRPHTWMPPPFWEGLAGDKARRGQTENFGRIYVQVPGMIRVEHGEQTRLALGRRWWQWGGPMLPLRGRGNVDGHLELDRLAPLLDPGHRNLGWALTAPDTRAEPMSEGRLNRRVTAFFTGVPCEVSELIAPVIDEPVEPELFVPPPLRFKDRDQVLPTRPLRLQEAARRLPFALYAPSAEAVPDPQRGVTVVLMPEAWASISYGDRRRRPQVGLVISQKAAANPAPDRWEELTSRSGHPWLRVTLRRKHTEIELNSVYDRATTTRIIDTLRPVKEA